MINECEVRWLDDYGDVSGIVWAGCGALISVSHFGLGVCVCAATA